MVRFLRNYLLEKLNCQKQSINIGGKRQRDGRPQVTLLVIWDSVWSRSRTSWWKVGLWDGPERQQAVIRPYLVTHNPIL